MLRVATEVHRLKGLSGPQATPGTLYTPPSGLHYPHGAGQRGSWGTVGGAHVTPSTDLTGSASLTGIPWGAAVPPKESLIHASFRERTRALSQAPGSGDTGAPPSPPDQGSCVLLTEQEAAWAPTWKWPNQLDCPCSFKKAGMGRGRARGDGERVGSDDACLVPITQKQVAPNTVGAAPRTNEHYPLNICVFLSPRFAS